MSRIQMMYRGWVSSDGAQFFPGLVDRDAFPEVPDDRFHKRGCNFLLDDESDHEHLMDAGECTCTTLPDTE